MEGADRFIISPAGTLRFRNIAGRGGKRGLVKLVNLILRWIHFSIETSFLVENDVYLYTARVETR